MPGKYSHGVVLANYSTRGVVDLSNDTQLDYLNSCGPPLSIPTVHQSGSGTRARTPSAPPMREQHPVVGPTSIKTSKSSRNRSSTISESRATSRQSWNGKPAHHQAKSPRAATSASRERKVIVKSDDEHADNGGSRKNVPAQFSLNPHTRPALNVHHFPPSAPAPEIFRERSRPQSSRWIDKFQANANGDITGPVRRYSTGFAAPKYPPKDALRHGPQSPIRQHLMPSPSEGHPDSISCAEPLLSVHDFLGGPAFAALQAQYAVTAPVLSITTQPLAEAVFPASPPPHIAELSSEPSTPPPHSLPRRSYMNHINLSVDEENSGESKDHSKQSIATTSVSALPLQNHTLSPTILDLREDEFLDSDEIPAVPRAPDLRENAIGFLRDTRQQREPIPDFAFPGGHDEGPVLPIPGISPSIASRTRKWSNDASAPAAKTTSVTVHGGIGVLNDAALAEPDFFHFSDDEGIRDPTDRYVCDIHVRRRYYRAIDKHIPSNELRTKISPSASPQSNRRSHSRPSLSSASGTSRTTSVDSDIQKPEKKTISIEIHDEELQRFTSARTSQASEEWAQKLESEEQIRMKIPTPIPSPTTTSPQTLASSLSPRTPIPENAASQVINFGVPSIVRLPPPGRRGNHTNMPISDTQRKSGTLGMQDIGRVCPQRVGRSSQVSHAGSNAQGTPHYSYLTEISDSEDEEIECWTSPTTPVVQDQRLRRTNAPKTSSAGLDSEARSRSVTPRPQTSARMPPHARGNLLTTTLGPAGRSLVSVFDDISSISSTGVSLTTDHDHELDTPIPRFQPFDLVCNSFAAHQVWQNGDDDADFDVALPPPDISRYPPASRSVSSPRSTKSDRNRLSSLTSLSNRSKTKRKSRAEPDQNRMDSLVQALNYDPWSGSDSRKARADGAEARARPGEVSGTDRLEAILLKAEEEAKANRGVKGMWSRLKRRIEG